MSDEEVKTEIFDSRTARYFAGHVEGTRKSSIPKPEIEPFGDVRVLYRDRATKYEILGEVVRGPYEEEGSPRVDYCPLDPSVSKAVEAFLESTDGQMEKIRSMLGG